MALLSTREGESNRIDDVNPALCRLTGFAPDELQGSDLIETLVHPSERNPARQDVEWLLAGDLSATVAERHYIHSNGGDIWVQTSVARLTGGSDGDQVVLQVQDITERKRFEQRTAPSRRSRSSDWIGQPAAVHRRARPGSRQRTSVGMATAVLVTDVDHLKDFNETYGHAAGDEVLAAVARMLSERTRETDTVGRLGRR